MVNNFIGVFPNAATKEYCERIIRRFDFVKETTFGERGKIYSRQEREPVTQMSKDDSTYFIGGNVRDDLPFAKADKAVLGSDSPLLKDFTALAWKHYDTYAKEYGVLIDVGRHKMSPYARVQKTEPGQGYHVWHCDGGGLEACRRLIAVSLYLNTVEEGGETEFLYQSTRVSPIEGTLVFFPAGWTHPHRGNPPLKGNKYILTTWLEYVYE